MGLARRLRRLEAVSQIGACEECGGLVPDDPGVVWEVVWHDEEGSDAPPELCSTCGRQTTFVVRWGDLEPEDPGEGAS